MDEIVKSRLFKAFLIPFLRYIQDRAFRYASHINLVSGGFKPLFTGYPQATVTEYTNGIDDMFLEHGMDCEPGWGEAGGIRTILYAGNIGDGQGLYKVIPRAAQLLGEGYRFIVYGDGGQKGLLENELARLKVGNVRILQPIPRNELIRAYCRADYLFIHLNDYKAFEKVLPSKIFELSAFPKPLIAGVGGFPRRFIEGEIPHSFVFAPGDAEAMAEAVRNFPMGQPIDRKAFTEKYKRSNINREMSHSILGYL
jgi:glycosyltransferase involved in cell wall biosynthesis